MSANGLAGFAVLSAVLILVYAGGVAGPFVLDDEINLQPIFNTLERGGLTALLSEYADLGGRPVAALSFALNYLFSGAESGDFKRINVLLHLVCGALVFGLSQSLFRFVPATRSSAWQPALIVTALWMLSPLFVSTVLYTVQRMSQLAALFSLAALWLYVSTRYRMIHGGITSLALGFRVLALLALGLLALFSKESAALLPLLCFVLEIRLISSCRSLRRDPLMSAAWALIAGVSFSAIAWMTLQGHISLGGYVIREFTLMERLLTESRVLWMYAQNLLLPDVSGFGVYHDDIVISRGFIKPWTTLAALAAWGGVLVFAVVARQRELRLLLTGLVFFLAGHLIESTVIPLELYFEHRNYLPAWGLYFGCVAALFALVDRYPAYAKIATGSALLLCMVFALGTFQKTSAWADEGILLGTAYVAHPRSPRLNSDLANWATRGGDFQRARFHTLRIAELRPEARTGVALQLLKIYCVFGKPLPAEDQQWLEWPITPTLKAYSTRAVQNLNRLAASQGCGDFDLGAAAEKLAAQALLSKARGDPGGLSIFYLGIGKALINGGRYAAAARYLEQLGGFEARVLQIELMLRDGDIAGAKSLHALLRSQSVAVSPELRHWYVQLEKRLHE